MSETADAALRRRTFIWVMDLTPDGQGICSGCRQQKEVFVPRRAIPRKGKERCLDCWELER